MSERAIESYGIEPLSVDHAARQVVEPIWLEQFTAPTPIRCRGSFHLYAARQLSSREPRLVIVIAQHANRAVATRRLRQLAAAHRLIQRGAFPPLAECGECRGQAFVSFAIAPLCDGEHAIGRLGETRTRVPYAEAMGVVEHLGSSLEAAHGTQDAQGRGLALGGMGWANVVIAADGMLYLIGLGHNVVGRDEHGAPSGTPSFFAPPELALGGPATPSADTFAFVMLQRSVLSYCALPGVLARVFSDHASEADLQLRELVAWSTERVLAVAPQQRACMKELRLRWLRECELLQLAPDLEGIRATLLRIVGREGPTPDAPSTMKELVLGPGGGWFHAPDGTCHHLVGRGPFKRILLRLAQERLKPDGQPLDVTALLEAGWPGQKVSRSAGLNRVYVAIATLRKMGLRGALQRDDQGYRIDPAIPVRFECPVAAVRSSFS